MSALIKIHLTEEFSKGAIEGKGKDCLVLLVEFLHSNPEVKHLFKEALRVEQLFALEQEMETWKEKQQ